MLKPTYQRETRFFLYFLGVLACAVLYLRSVCWRNPTSVFFQAQRAHVPGYSAYRLAQGIDFADEAATSVSKRPDGEDTPPPRICVGIPSIKRKGISYLKSTLGSLQQGLEASERDSLAFVVLLGHTNTSEHPDFGQPWLENMADGLLTYKDNSSYAKLARKLEKSHHHEPKQIFDVSLVMEECVRRNPDYIMVVEDDVVALDGWYHRTLGALEEARIASAELGRTSFLYLRLFYYEGLLGWNSENWFTYLRYSVAFTMVETVVLLAIRHYWAPARSFLSRLMLLLLLGVCTPLSIGLFFAAGPTYMFPTPAGVNLMPKFACCGQGLVFPREQITDHVLPVLQQARERLDFPTPVDSLIEKYADRNDALRWALTPVVLQHVGGKSSHGVRRNKFGTMTPTKIFNFQFETNDPDALAAEHHHVYRQQSPELI
ncbi:hypothetical protein F4780DRAFT_778807 [Xylariomycetidae sp. FL0641]|nr:hypothetical protein F4780DRAFT_778807 [Xylariomycetidae sp. FL0641]